MTENDQQILPPVQKIAAALREVLATPADADAQERARQALAEFDAVGTAYVVVQEGGSSGELYIHSAESEEIAHEFRESCARSAYRTSGVIEVPAHVAACGEGVYQLLSDAACADLEYAEVEDEEDDEDDQAT